MNAFQDQRCAVHDVALRPDGTCVLCLRERPVASAGASGAPTRGSQRVEPYERKQSTLGTAFFGVMFVLSVALGLWWLLSPETLKALFR